MNQLINFLGVLVSMIASANSAPPSPAVVSARVLVFCFAEKIGKGPCDFSRFVNPELGTFEAIYVSEAGTSPDKLQQLFCSAVQRSTEEFLLVQLTGKGMTRANAWKMEWTDRQGISRKVLDPNETLQLLFSCFDSAPSKRISVRIDGRLRSGRSYVYDIKDSLNHPKVNSFGSTYSERMSDMDFNNTLQADAEKRGVAGWSEDIETVAYVPTTAPVAPECKQFWSRLLQMDAVEIAQGNVGRMPTPGKCLAVSRVVQDDHKRYLETCRPFLGGENETSTSEEKFSCRHGFLYYRSALRHWSTREQTPELISDRIILAEKLFWLSNNINLSRYREQVERRLKVAKRLLELRPQNLAALAEVLEAAGSLATSNEEKKLGKEIEEASWKHAEKYADKVIAMDLPDTHRFLKDSAWHAKTWGMRQERLALFKERMSRELANWDGTSLSVSTAWAPPGEMFMELVK